MQITSFGKNKLLKLTSSGILVAAIGFVPLTASADSGLYLGGSIGSATIQAEIPDEDLGEVFTLDENDFAWKAFGGYKFDLSVVNLGIEGGYVDLGAPSGELLGSAVGLDVTGWDVFAVAGVAVGPVDIFAKAGLISWDADAIVDDTREGIDDGSDPAYGIGVGFNFGSLELRGEYEYFDIEPAEDVYMLSAGFVYHFGG